MSFATSDTYRFEFSTYNTSGALANADSTPTGTLVVGGTDNAATVTISTAATGRYKGSVSLSTLANGSVFYVRVVATVGGVTQEVATKTDRILAPSDLQTIAGSINWVDQLRTLLGGFTYDTAGAQAAEGLAGLGIAFTNDASVPAEILASTIRDAVGLTSANLDTQLAATASATNVTDAQTAIEAAIAPDVR